MSRFFLMMLFFISIASSQSSEDIFFVKGLNAYQSEKYNESLIFFVKLVKKSPEEPKYWFNLGSTYFKLKDYKRAALAYSQVVRLKGDLLPMAQLYRGVALLKIGKPDLALESVAQIETAQLPKNILKKVGSFRRELESYFYSEFKKLYSNGQYNTASELLKDYLKKGGEYNADIDLFKKLLSEKLSTENWQSSQDMLGKSSGQEIRVHKASNLEKWLIQVKLSLGRNSNIYGENETDGQESSLTGLIDFFVGKTLKYQEIQLTPYYNLVFDNAFAIDFDKIIDHSLGVIAFHPFYTSGSIRVNPNYKKSLIAGEEYLSTISLNAQILKPVFNFELRGFLDVADESGEGEFSYLKGSYSLAEFGIGKNFKSFFVELILTAGNDKLGDLELDQGTIPMSHSKFGWGAFVFWSISSKNKISLHYTNLMKTYSNKLRKDEFLLINTTYSYKFKSSVTGSIFLSRISNSSTFDETAVENKNYEITKFGLGIKWEFL